MKVFTLDGLGDVSDAELSSTVSDLLSQLNARGKISKGALKRAAKVLKQLMSGLKGKPLEKRVKVYKQLMQHIDAQLATEPDATRRAQLAQLRQEIKKDTKGLKAELSDGGVLDKLSVGLTVVGVPGALLLNSKVQDTLKKALPVAALAAPAFPVLAPFATALKTAVAVNKAYEAKKQYDAEKEQSDDAKKAERAYKQQRTDFVAALQQQGVPTPQAEKIVQLVESGLPIEQAYSQVMVNVAPTPAAAAPSTVTPAPAVPPSPASEEVAMEQYMKWLKSWNPQLYSAVSQQLAVTPPAPTMGGLDLDTGLWDGALPGLGGLVDDFVSTVTSVADKLLPTLYQKKILEEQLKRAKQGLPPAPTQVVAQQAAVETKAAGQPVPMTIFGMSPVAAGGVGLGIAAALYFAFGGGSRRRRR